MPLAATLLRLAAALDVSADQLLAGVEWDVTGRQPDDPGSG